MAASLVAHWSQYPAAHDRLLSFIGIAVHWSILQYVLGLPFLAFIAYLIYLKTGAEKWRKLSRTLVKGFVIVFAVGAATGTASEFGLVLLWPNLTQAAGRYIYFPLYAEVFAFMMEVVFIYMLWYGWNKFGKKALAIVMLFALIGPWFSAAMIVSVNSYMVAPTGIEPAYNPQTGQWLYNEHYPKLMLVVPMKYVQLLNVSLLQSVGMQVVKPVTVNGEKAVVVYMPATIVQRLAYESWHGYTVKDSILHVVLKPEYQNNTAVLNTPVMKIVDDILTTTIKYVGVMSVAFKSPVYRASILHVMGSAITVSSFTVMAAYALRKLKRHGKGNKEYEEYVETAFRYAAAMALIFITIQGLVFGHMMGRDIATYNPEKFAAMEGQTSYAFSIDKAFHLDKLMSFIAYGSTSAKLPNYDAIPNNYCACKLTEQQDMARIGTCKPPIIIHYIYYTKIGLAILVGLYALLIHYYLIIRKKDVPAWALKLALPAAVVIMMVSWMGWAVREIGRKPWTIYGVMTPDVAHTFNPAPTWAVATVALFFIVVLLALAYSVWKFLYLPGKQVAVEG